MKRELCVKVVENLKGARSIYTFMTFIDNNKVPVPVKKPFVFSFEFVGILIVFVFG